MVSPLALFESLGDDPSVACSQPWVEQVDFRLPALKSILPSRSKTATKKLQSLPSLEEITARLTSCNHDPRLLSSAHARPANERRRLAIGVGRLQIPVRSPQPTKVGCSTILPPGSPRSPLSPQLQITTIVVPRSASLSPTELSETNLLALDSRQRRAREMLSALKRRTIPSDKGRNGRDDAMSEASDDRKFRRQSAPADLFPRPRTGFEHPILKLPGAF